VIKPTDVLVMPPSATVTAFEVLVTAAVTATNSDNNLIFIFVFYLILFIQG
jgi:hypothetical protein